MATTKRYSPEVKQRAINMVLEHKDEYSSIWKTVVSVSEKLPMSAETLRKWVRQHEINNGRLEGITTSENEHLKKFESSENKELRRANEILRDASIFFATELDGQTKK